MSDIPVTHLESRKGQVDSPDERTRYMPDEPGRRICNNLISIQKEIERVNPSNKVELKEAVRKLWQFGNCSKMRRER